MVEGKTIGYIITPGDGGTASGFFYFPKAGVALSFSGKGEETRYDQINESIFLKALSKDSIIWRDVRYFEVDLSLVKGLQEAHKERNDMSNKLSGLEDRIKEIIDALSRSSESAIQVQAEE